MSARVRRWLMLTAAGLALLAIGVGSGEFLARRLSPSPVATQAISSSPSPSPSPQAVPSPTPSPLAGCPAGQAVTDAPGLTQALKAARPGAVIVLAAGTYAGRFEATVTGTADAPITLCGSRDAVIDGGDIKLGYSLHLNSVDWWRLIGFTIQGGQKGVVTDHVHHVLISGLYVHDVGDEAIHLRSASTDNTIEGVLIRNTGHLVAKFGEGIYVGSANHNWCKYSGCGPDTSDRNVVRNNDISNTTAENIDIKEGTTGGTIEGNHLSGEGMVRSAATAWVNVKGNGWTIVGNVGHLSLKDGFQVHRVYAGWGERNLFRANQAAVDGPGYGIYVQSASLATIVMCDNTATGAASGLSNTPCRNA